MERHKELIANSTIPYKPTFWEMNPIIHLKSGDLIESYEVTNNCQNHLHELLITNKNIMQNYKVDHFEHKIILNNLLSCSNKINYNELLDFVLRIKDICNRITTDEISKFKQQLNEDFKSDENKESIEEWEFESEEEKEEVLGYWDWNKSDDIEG
jgi:hypothetical protein